MFFWFAIAVGVLLLVSAALVMYRLQAIAIHTPHTLDIDQTPDAGLLRGSEAATLGFEPLATATISAAGSGRNAPKPVSMAILRAPDSSALALELPSGPGMRVKLLTAWPNGSYLLTTSPAPRVFANRRGKMVVAQGAATPADAWSRHQTALAGLRESRGLPLPVANLEDALRCFAAVKPLVRKAMLRGIGIVVVLGMGVWVVAGLLVLNR